MFDPTVGRWLQEDPIGFNALDPNLYRYVKNSPTNATDPSGLADDPVAIEESIEKTELLGINEGIKKGTFKQDKAYLKTFDTKTPRGDAIKIAVDKGYIGSTISTTKKNVNGKVQEVKTAQFGAYVKIDVTVDTDRYDLIRLIQVMRYITAAPDGKGYVSADPVKELRREKCDWANKEAVSPGWFVDSTDNAETFFVANTYVYNSKKQAIEWDYPSVSVEGYGRATKIGIEFYTVAIGLKEGKIPDYLGGVRWGFYIDDKQVVKFDPAVPELLKGPPQELGDALAKWNKFWAGKFNKNLDDFFKLSTPDGPIGIEKIEGVTIPRLEPEPKKK